MVIDGPALNSTICTRALDTLDFAVLVMSSDFERVIHLNQPASKVLGDAIPQAVADAIRTYVQSRRDMGRPPPALRLELGETAYYLRVISSEGDPPLEIVFLREEILRDVDLFRLVNTRYGVERRAYQVLTAIRLGKTNRQISTELGLAEGTIRRHVENLLQRFEVANRTQLASIVERLAARRV